MGSELEQGAAAVDDQHAAVVAMPTAAAPVVQHGPPMIFSSSYAPPHATLAVEPMFGQRALQPQPVLAHVLQPQPGKQGQPILAHVVPRVQEMQTPMVMAQSMQHMQLARLLPIAHALPLQMAHPLLLQIDQAPQMARPMLPPPLLQPMSRTLMRC